MQPSMHWPYCTDGQCVGCLPDLSPAHVCEPVKGPLGVMVCEGCTLEVPRPPAMPDYSGAAMRHWRDDS